MSKYYKPAITRSNLVNEYTVDLLAKQEGFLKPGDLIKTLLEQYCGHDLSRYARMRIAPTELGEGEDDRATA